jgi:hypothetical protein
MEEEEPLITIYLILIDPVDLSTNSSIILSFEKHYIRTHQNETKQLYQVDNQHWLHSHVTSSLLPTTSGDTLISNLYFSIIQRKKFRLCTLKGNTVPSISHPFFYFISLDKLSQPSKLSPPLYTLLLFLVIEK